jgi:phage RecT family recombinase
MTAPVKQHAPEPHAPQNPLVTAIDQHRDQLATYLPRGAPRDRFMAIAKRAVLDNPDLLECSTQSVLRAVAACAASGLPLDGRFSSLVVRRPRQGRPVAVWDPTYRGMVYLALESGHVVDVASYAVHARDEFTYELGASPRVFHRPWIKGDRGPVVAAYAVATLKDGGKVHEVLGRDDLERIRAASPAGDKGPWSTWPDRMASKSAMRRLLKRLPAADIGTLERARQHVAEYDDGEGESFMARAEPASAARKLPEDSAALEAQAIEALADCGSLDVLTETWSGIRAEFRRAGFDLPLSVESRYHDRREALAQSRGGEL